ncbi:hypothetical protein [Megalodesulfovibrio paquesii]
MSIRWLHVLPILLALLAHPECIRPAIAETTRKLDVQLKETYTDNVNDNTRHEADFITSLNIDSSFSFIGSRTSFTATSHTSVLDYALGTRDREYRTDTLLNGALQLFPELLTLRLSDQFKSVFADPSQGQTSESDSVSSQVNSNLFTASLAFTPFSHSRTTPIFQYSYTNQIYDGQGLINKQAHSLLAEVTHACTPTFDLIFGTLSTVQQSDNNGFHRVKGYAGWAWAMSSTLSLNAKAGGIWTEYDENGQQLQPYWDVRLEYLLGRTTFTLGSNADFIESASTALSSLNTKSYLTIAKNWDRTKLTGQISYDTYGGEDTKSSQLYGISLGLNYDLTERLALATSARLQHRDSSDSDRQTIYGNLGLTYALPQDMKLGANYKLKYNTGSEDSDHYDTNTWELLLSKTF